MHETRALRAHGLKIAFADLLPGSEERDDAFEQGQQVRGTESDNMGFDIGALDDIRLLHTDGQKLWLWSDKARMGFIFPKIGF